MMPLSRNTLLTLLPVAPSSFALPTGPGGGIPLGPGRERRLNEAGSGWASFCKVRRRSLTRGAQSAPRLCSWSNGMSGGGAWTAAGHVTTRGEAGDESRKPNHHRRTRGRPSGGRDRDGSGAGGARASGGRWETASGSALLLVTRHETTLVGRAHRPSGTHVLERQRQKIKNLHPSVVIGGYKKKNSQKIKILR